MAFSLFILSFIVCVWTSSAYTIAFHSNVANAGDNNHGLLNRASSTSTSSSSINTQLMKESLSATQVADIFLRLNGQPPILREGACVL